MAAAARGRAASAAAVRSPRVAASGRLPPYRADVRVRDPAAGPGCATCLLLRLPRPLSNLTNEAPALRTTTSWKSRVTDPVLIGIMTAGWRVRQPSKPCPACAGLPDLRRPWSLGPALSLKGSGGPLPSALPLARTSQALSTLGIDRLHNSVTSFAAPPWPTCQTKCLRSRWCSAASG